MQFSFDKHALALAIAAGWVLIAIAHSAGEGAGALAYHGSILL